MSATIKPRAGRLRIIHESAPCSSNRIPSRFRLELRSLTSPRGSAITYTPVRACPPHRGHVAPNETRVGGRRAATILNLKTTCPPGGFPLNEKVDVRHRFFDS